MLSASHIGAHARPCVCVCQVKRPTVYIVSDRVGGYIPMPIHTVIPIYMNNIDVCEPYNILITYYRIHIYYYIIIIICTRSGTRSAFRDKRVVYYCNVANTRIYIFYTYVKSAPS